MLKALFALRLPFALMVMAALCLAGYGAPALASVTDQGATMKDRIQAANSNKQALFNESSCPLANSDPDIVAIRDRLIYGEIAERGTLNTRQRQLITLVTLTTCQTLEPLQQETEAALRAGVTPVEIKEALYQCAPYIGFPKTESALRRVNDVFAAQGIALPVASQATVTEDNRFDRGLAVQKSIFGKAIDTMHATAPEGQKDILVNHLSAFCFGDIYTRTGLDLPTRELLTFAIVSALGGCEAQVKAHVQGNANVGNSKQTLIDTLAQMLPYIGFPRTLNALGCVNAVLQDA